MFVVISEGCQECGVGSIFVGLFDDQNIATVAAEAQEDGWRDGGQCNVVMYDTGTKLPVDWRDDDD